MQVVNTDENMEGSSFPSPVPLSAEAMVEVRRRDSHGNNRVESASGEQPAASEEQPPTSGEQPPASGERRNVFLIMISFVVACAEIYSSAAILIRTYEPDDRSFSGSVLDTLVKSEIAGLIMGLVAAILCARNGRGYWSEVIGHPLFNASSKLWPEFPNNIRNGIVSDIPVSSGSTALVFRHLFVMSAMNWYYIGHSIDRGGKFVSTFTGSISYYIALEKTLIVFGVYRRSNEERYNYRTECFKALAWLPVLSLCSPATLEIVKIAILISAARANNAISIEFVVLAVIDVVMIIPVFIVTVILLKDMAITSFSRTSTATTDDPGEATSVR